MNEARLTVEPLAAAHDRSGFSCGAPALDRYLREQAGQDARRRVAAPFVAISDGRIVGFYTLSAASIVLSDVPPDLARRLPRYPGVPATLLGRLAIDMSVRKQGLGRFLLIDAMARSLRSEIASFAFVVEAKDVAAGAFYRSQGFIPLPGNPSRLMRRMSDIASLFGD